MKFRRSSEKFECFRVMDLDGNIINKPYENIDKEKALKIFNVMVKIHESDTRLNMAQREGKISFYMTCTGEEASVTASCAALEDCDMIFPQYREAACILYRGIPLQTMVNHLAANELDNGKGRQMPVHYGYNSINFQTVSSPLCTQVPQASGAGYHFRCQNLDKVAVTYFGEGAASEGDFHSALNFASTLNCQTLFICRNNMYAISTPIDDQYKGDGIAARGIAYGINTLRVDGNDVFAVYNAVKTAREYIIQNKAPALVEIMSYRGGDHSTSDFSKMYRNEEEMKKWNEFIEKIGNPIQRYYKYLERKKWITEEEYKKIIDSSREEVRECLKTSLKFKKPSIDSLFDDVYENIPEHLLIQKENLKRHIQKYADEYEIEKYGK
jgi:2-oxoisovalerate dehydrogenase E1 component alpha subunit